MNRRNKLIAWIHEELRRIGCREIVFSGGMPVGDAVFRREKGMIAISLELAHRLLFVVPSYAGDDAAWAVLLRGGAPEEEEEDEPGLSRGARPR